MRMRPMFIAVALLTAACVFATTASAITIRDDRTQQQYLNLGAQFAAVGRVDEQTAAGNYIGSGTLIASNWVLTAAHMVDSAAVLKFTIGGSSYMADSWFDHPSWTGDLLAGYDIALVKLTRTVPGITPAALYTGTGELGKVGTMVGYGMTGTGKTGANKFDGKKRGAQNMIDTYYGSSARILLVDFDNPRNARDNAYGSAVPQNLEGLIAPGDSGGGLFVNFGKGPLLAGVTSFGASYDGKTNSDYGDVGGFIRVSAFTDWIGPILSGTSSATATGAFSGGTSGAAGAVPEPTTLALAGMGLAALAARRKRRQ